MSGSLNPFGDYFAMAADPAQLAAAATSGVGAPAGTGLGFGFGWGGSPSSPSMQFPGATTNGNALNPQSYIASLLAQQSPTMTSPWAYNASLFPQGLHTNGSGQFMTPYNQQWTGGAGWTNVLTPNAQGQVGQLPSWAGAANPLQATQMASQQQDVSVYGTHDPQRLGLLGSAGFPLWSDPRMQQDFAANTFGMTPATWSQQTYGTPLPWGGAEGGGGDENA